MYKLHEDIKGIHYIIKNKYLTEYKTKIRTSLIKNIDKALKKSRKSGTEVEFDIPFMYRTAYHDWWELKQFMILFDLNTEELGVKTLAYKTVKLIGDDIPILGIGNGLFKWSSKPIDLNFSDMHYQYKFIKYGYKLDYFSYLKYAIKKEFEFIDILFKWARTDHPNHKQRAIKALQYNKNENTKKINILKNFNLNEQHKAKIYLLEKLLEPYHLKDELKETLISLLKLK